MPIFRSYVAYLRFCLRPTVRNSQSFHVQHRQYTLDTQQWRTLSNSNCVRQRQWQIWNLAQKWSQDHHHKLTTMHRLHKPILSYNKNRHNSDPKPPCFKQCQGIYASQYPSFCQDYWHRAQKSSLDRIPCFSSRPTPFSAIYAHRFS